MMDLSFETDFPLACKTSVLKIQLTIKVKSSDLRVLASLADRGEVHSSTKLVRTGPISTPLCVA